MYNDVKQMSIRPQDRKRMTKIIAVRVDPELKAELERAAADEHRTVSNLILRLVREYLAKSKRGRKQ